MNAISFAARKLPDPFLLVAAGEIEPGNVSTRIHFPLSQLNDVEPIGNLFPDRFVCVEIVTGLIYVAKLDRWANLELAAIGIFLFSYQPKQCRLASTVRPDHADNTAGRKREFHLFKKQFVVVTLRHPVSFDHGVAKSL